MENSGSCRRSPLARCHSATERTALLNLSHHARPWSLIRRTTHRRGATDQHPHVKIDLTGETLISNKQNRVREIRSGYQRCIDPKHGQSTDRAQECDLPRLARGSSARAVASRVVSGNPSQDQIALASWPDILAEYRWQFRMGWSLATDFYMTGLTDEICLWMPHSSASTVRPLADATWEADWSEPPPGEPWHSSVAWLTWHIQWWLTSALAEARQEEVPERTAIRWPGTADGIRVELERLANAWRTMLDDAVDLDPNRPTLFPWPDPRPFHRLVGWANLELMKNIAEIGILFNLAQRGWPNIPTPLS